MRKLWVQFQFNTKYSREYSDCQAQGMLSLAPNCCNRCAEWTEALPLIGRMQFFTFSINSIPQLAHHVMVVFLDSSLNIWRNEQCHFSRKKCQQGLQITSIYLCFFRSLRAWGSSTLKTEPWFWGHRDRPTIRHLQWKIKFSAVWWTITLHILHILYIFTATKSENFITVRMRGRVHGQSVPCGFNLRILAPLTYSF